MQVIGRTSFLEAAGRCRAARQSHRGHRRTI